MGAFEIAKNLIKESEGLRLEAYKCPADRWTCGWGQTGSDVKEGTVWTKEYAETRLDFSVRYCVSVATASSPILSSARASQEQLAAIVSFIFNLGISNYEKSTLKLRIDQGNWVSAATEIKRWNKGRVNGTLMPLPGLTIRREKEARLLLKQITET
jgi:lysozyme